MPQEVLLTKECLNGKKKNQDGLRYVKESVLGWKKSLFQKITKTENIDRNKTTAI